MSRTKSQGLDTCDTQSIILPVVITCSGVVLLTGVLVIALFRKKCNKKIPLHDHELASHQPVKPRSDQSTIYQSIPQEIDYDKCDIPEFH